MSRRDFWQQIYERFDPEQPAIARWRADRPPGSPADQIVEQLRMPFSNTRTLLMGTTGTGKTTELLRVVEDPARGEVVIFLELSRHFSEVVRDNAALQHIRAWEVCFLVGLKLIATLQEKLSYEFPAEDVKELRGSWKGIAGASETPQAAQLDIAALAKTMMGAAGAAAPTVVGGSAGAGVATGLGIGGAVAGALSKLTWNLPLGRSKQFLPDQDSHVQKLLVCVNTLIGQFQSQHRRLLVVIDGLDRINDVERAKELFVDSQLISQLACSVIVCAPFVLRHHPATAVVRGFEQLVLVNEPVLDHDAPERHGPGVRFFCDLFERRSADLRATDLIARPLLEKLAYFSGGRARDFVKLVRLVARGAWLEDVPSATDEIVEKVLDKERRTLEIGLHKEHVQLLEEVANDPLHRPPSGPLAEELLNYHRLLPYPNESEWYYPHPLLMMHLVRTKAPGSKS
jgi:hypothetical protein